MDAHPEMSLLDGDQDLPSVECRSSEERIRNLKKAVLTARLIGQAQGILMARHACSADQAFQELVDASQRSNRKLHAVAAAVVQHREMPKIGERVDAVTDDAGISQLAPPS